MKKREMSFTNMFKKTDKTIDYFHSGRLKEHIFKCRIKKRILKLYINVKKNVTFINSNIILLCVF